MAQNQATGGNSMAATLGNLQNRTQRPGMPPTANYGAGMQAPMQGMGQVWRGPRPTPGGMQPIPPGGPGYPQMSPAAMQNMMGQLSSLQQQKPMQQLQSGAPGNMGMIPQNPNLGGALGNMGRRPMPAMGAPGMGAGGGKNQQIAQLPGAPPMGR